MNVSLANDTVRTNTSSKRSIDAKNNEGSTENKLQRLLEAALSKCDITPVLEILTRGRGVSNI